MKSGKRWQRGGLQEKGLEEAKRKEREDRKMPPYEGALTVRLCAYEDSVRPQHVVPSVRQGKEKSRNVKV